MIRPLRKRHRLVFIALALIVPPLLAAALLGRPRGPSQPPPPEGDGPAAAVLTQRLQSWGGGSLRASVVRAEDGGFAVVVELLDPGSHPELLVYWDPAAGPDGAALPQDAYLLGRLAGTAPQRMALPRGAAQSGRLILYDLPHQQRVTSFELELSPPPDAEAE